MRKEVTFEEAKTRFNKYLKDNNIVIEDIYSFNYSEIIRESGLEKHKKEFCTGMLDFIVKYHEYNCPAYKFKSHNVVYWENKDNRIWNLKWLIENDLKLSINKIPLYITKLSIRKLPHTTTLYNVLHNHYNGNLYNWINECYPNIFIEKDFDIGFIKQEFDSVEERQIDDVLHNDIKNVYYNNLHSNNVVNLNGMIPDWLIFGKELILVEYFGYFMDNPKTSRQEAYMKTYHEKIEKYKDLPYKTLLIYPNDLNNNFQGLLGKINKIKGVLI